MIPEFLQPFAAQLEKYALPSIKIKATPLAADGPPSQASKFGGLPFLPVSLLYPSQPDGAPLLLLAQINLSELPANQLLPPAGLLQFYVSAHEWYDYDNELSRVLFIEPAQLGEVGQTDFSFLPTDHTDDSPINGEHHLAFAAATEYGGLEDERFTFHFDGLAGYEFEEKLPEAEQQVFSALLSGAGHKLGGYAYFTQGDPRTFSPGLAGDMQLLQIDIDDRIMFGDSGVAHFFIEEQALRNREFDKAYFYWDCC